MVAFLHLKKGYLSNCTDLFLIIAISAEKIARQTAQVSTRGRGHKGQIHCNCQRPKWIQCQVHWGYDRGDYILLFVLIREE